MGSKVWDNPGDFVEGKKYDVYVRVKITGVFRGWENGILKFDTGMKFIRLGINNRGPEPTIRFVNPDEIAAAGEYK